MKIEIVQAKIQQKPILANLLELYSYEFTQFFDFDIGENGFYGYPWLSQYWSDPARFPYLIYVDEKIAGFVLVQKGSPIDEDSEIYDIAEFFIMQKYKRKHVGITVANKIWKMRKGPWQVRVLVMNKIACLFWKKAIKQFTHKEPIATELEIKNDHWLIYRFSSMGGA